MSLSGDDEGEWVLTGMSTGCWSSPFEDATALSPATVSMSLSLDLSLGPIIYLCLSQFLWSLPRRLHHAGVDSPWSRAFSTCWLSKLSICDLQPLLGPQKNFSFKYPSRIVSGCVHDQLTKFWGSCCYDKIICYIVRIDREFWHDPESHLLLNRTMRLMCTRCW